jgi:hypothetical protein
VRRKDAPVRDSDPGFRRQERSEDQIVEVAMSKLLRVVVAVSLVALVLSACSSGASKPDRGGGFRVLDAVVVERSVETDPTGRMSYYLGFEAKDGEATAHMRYPVTRDQYMRYPEGTRVQLVLADDRLREIRRASEK